MPEPCEVIDSAGDIIDHDCVGVIVGGDSDRDRLRTTLELLWEGASEGLLAWGDLKSTFFPPCGDFSFGVTTRRRAAAGSRSGKGMLWIFGSTDGKLQLQHQQ
mmetsp:Transcript_7125/g.11310  ORF Transcript_7125/g.11310 Transcript_7125/m.11310 type:complete len:103 (-) Transcript_7125:23-331(-)